MIPHSTKCSQVPEFFFFLWWPCIPVFFNDSVLTIDSHPHLFQSHVHTLLFLHHKKGPKYELILQQNWLELSERWIWSCHGKRCPHIFIKITIWHPVLFHICPNFSPNGHFPLTWTGTMFNSFPGCGNPGTHALWGDMKQNHKTYLRMYERFSTPGDRSVGGGGLAGPKLKYLTTACTTQGSVHALPCAAASSANFLTMFCLKNPNNSISSTLIALGWLVAILKRKTSRGHVIMWYPHGGGMQAKKPAK